MYKVKNNLSPKIVSNIFSRFLAPYVFRNEKVWETGNVRTTIYGTETISYRGPQIWKYVPNDIKNSKTLTEFKNKIKIWKPADCTCRLCKKFIPSLGYLLTSLYFCFCISYACLLVYLFLLFLFFFFLLCYLFIHLFIYINFIVE